MLTQHTSAFVLIMFLAAFRPKTRCFYLIPICRLTDPVVRRKLGGAAGAAAKPFSVQSSGTSKVDVVTRWRRKWHISKPRRSLARAETIHVTNTPNFPRRIALSDGRFLSARPIGPFRLKNTAIRSKYKRAIMIYWYY